MKRLFLILGLLVGISQAQTTTTITGTIKDLSQALVTSGKVTFTLQPSRDTTISGLARFSPAQVVCLINASGLIKAQDGTSVCTLTMNTALNPPGTYYRVDVWPFNVKTSSFTFYAVLSTYDWSTVVPTPTTSPAQNFVDIFSNQTIGGAKSFSGLVSFPGGILGNGANNWTGVNLFTTQLNFTNAGIFTNTQMNEYVQSLINGCSPLAEFQAVQGGSAYATEGLVGCVTGSAGATAHQNNGVSGYATTSATANFAVGGYFQGRCLANNTQCWGSNSVVQDIAGLTAGLTLTHEFDCQPRNGAAAYTSVQCGLFDLFAPSVAAGTPLPTAFGPTCAIGVAGGIYQSCFNTSDGAAAIFGVVGSAATTANSASQPLNFNFRDSGNVVRVSGIKIDSSGNFVLTPFGGILKVGSNPLVQEVSSGTVDLTAQSAAITTTTLFAVPSTGAGQYRLIWDAKVTTAAGTSSTLGALTITYTDPDGVVQTITAPATIAAGTIATSSTANTTTTVLLGLSLLLNCKASTNIQYAFAYASVAANAMQYNLHLRLEAL